MSHAATMSDDWKKNPLVWMLIAIPSSAIVMGIVMLTLAIKSDTGLVHDDYYKHGKQINMVLARDKAAFERGIAADLSFNFDQGKVAIRFVPGAQITADEIVHLNMVHATKPGLDQLIPLSFDGLNSMTGELLRVPPGEGRWNLHLESGDWRVIGSIQMPASSRSNLTPNY